MLWSSFVGIELHSTRQPVNAAKSAEQTAEKLASMRVLSLIGRRLKNREARPRPGPPPIGFLARQLLSF
jgi:hypothetical protein